MTFVPVPILEILSAMVDGSYDGQGSGGEARHRRMFASSDEHSESPGSVSDPSPDNRCCQCCKVLGLMRWKSGDEPSRSSLGDRAVKSSGSDAVCESVSRRGYCQHPGGRSRSTYL